MIEPAHTAFDNKNYVTAKSYFDQLIQLEPQNIEFLEKRGFCNLFIGKFQAAIQDFDQGLTVDSTRSSLYFYKGLTYHRNNQYVLSNRSLFQAIRLRPSLKATYNLIGLNYIKLDRNDEACEYFTKGVKIGDANARKSVEAYCIVKDSISTR